MKKLLSILAVLLLAATGQVQAGSTGNTCNPSVVANPNSGNLIAGGPAVNFIVTIGLGDCPTDQQISYSGSITYFPGVGIHDDNAPCNSSPLGILDGGNPSDEFACAFKANADAVAGVTATVSAGIQGSWIDPPAGESPTGLPQLPIATFTVVRQTDLTVTKTGGGDVFAPAPFAHTISVENAGPSYATTIVLTDVTDPVPAGVTGPTYATPSHGSVVNNVWTITELPNATTATLVVNYTTTNTSSGTVHNTATVTGNAENAGSTDLSDDETSTVIPVIDIAVTSTESIDPVLAGWPGTGNLTYVLTAANAGPGLATGLALSANLTWPTGVTVNSVTPSVGSATNGWPTTWTIGNLASGADETLTIVLTVGTEAAEGTDVIDLSANVSAVTGADANAANDTTLQATSIAWAEATFDVTKEYLTGDAGPVTVSVQCTDGSGNIEYDPASGPTPALLTVRRFDAATTCSVVETVPAGYVETERTADCDVNPVDDAGAYTCTISNSVIPRATFRVTKFFDDGNNVDEITVSIDCNTGLILDQDKDLSDGEWVEFIVTDYTEGNLACTITEDGTTGYSGEYDNVSLGNIISDESCAYAADTIVGEAAHECVITNFPDPVDIVVHKEWVIAGTATAIDMEYEIDLYCQAGGMTGPNAHNDGDTNWHGYEYSEGDNTFTWQIIPLFPTSTCYAVEYNLDSYVEVENGCDNLVVSAGTEAECTITNTVFFEGIPTLSQYGMAILALLMLGVGFVSFRRFS